MVTNLQMPTLPSHLYSRYRFKINVENDWLFKTFQTKEFSRINKGVNVT